MRIKCRLYYCVYSQASGATQRRSLRRRASVRIWPASVPCRDCRAAQTYGGRADSPAGAPGPAFGKRRRRTAPCGRCRRRCEFIPASIPVRRPRGLCFSHCRRRRSSCAARALSACAPAAARICEKQDGGGPAKPPTNQRRHARPRLRAKERAPPRQVRFRARFSGILGRAGRGRGCKISAGPI